MPDGIRQQPSPRLPGVLSLMEAIALADVPEKLVRKDIEQGILTGPTIVRLPGNRLGTPPVHVFVLAAAYGEEGTTPRLRKGIVQAVLDHPDWQEASEVGAEGLVDGDALLGLCLTSSPIRLGRFLWLDSNAVLQVVRPRMALYADGLTRVETRPKVLGGSVVFKGTRLSVAHIGQMMEDGTSIEEMLENFPPLTQADLDFAALYLRANPPLGRPRKAA